MTQDLSDKQKKVLGAASDMNDVEQGGPVPAELYMEDLLTGGESQGAVVPTWLGETPDDRDKAARNAAAKIQTKIDPIPNSGMVGMRDVREFNPADAGSMARTEYGDPREDVILPGGYTRGRGPGGKK